MSTPSKNSQHTVNMLLVSGYTTQEIAEKLAISVGTVNNLSAYRKGEYDRNK